MGVYFAKECAMKIDLRRGMRLCALFALIFGTHACAQAPLEHEESLLKKAVYLSDTACTIYPAIGDTLSCTDKVLRKILKDRGISTERADQIIRDQGTASPESGFARTLGEVIRIACAAPPTITDKNACMDRVYHSIISSRDPHSEYFNKEEAEKYRKVMTGERQVPSSGSDKAVAIPMVSTAVLAVPNDPDTRYGYVRLALFGSDLRKKMVSAVKGLQREIPDMKGMIFDLRGNPGGWVVEAYEAVDALVESSEPLLSIRDKDGIRGYGTIPGFQIREPQPGDILSGLPIGVLIDNRSLSASEFFAGALKKLERSVTIGKGTWRKGTVQNHVEQSDGSLIKMTVAEYLIGSPTNWTAVQCVGVDPDIEYEVSGTIRPKTAKHECDLDGAVASGGRSSDPRSTEVPLRQRDLLRYAIGLEMTEAVRAFDNKKSAK